MSQTLLEIVQGLEPRLLQTLSGIHITFDGTNAQASLSFHLFGPSGIGRAFDVDTTNLPEGVTFTGISRYPNLEKPVILTPSMEEQIRELHRSNLVGELDAVRLDADADAVKKGHVPASWIVKTHAGSDQERLAWMKATKSNFP